jgi:hypothetical protein
MIDANDYTQLEALFAQEHQELLKPASDAARAHRVVIIEIDENSSKSLARCLAEAATIEERIDYRARLGYALDRETHSNHPENSRYDEMRFEAIRKAIASYWPVIAARREFSNTKRVDLIGAEKEFFLRFGGVRKDTHLHELVTSFERVTKIHEFSLDRHGHAGFNLLLPSCLAALVTPPPSAPTVRPESISDPALRRGAMDVAFNAKAAEEEVAKQARIAGLAKKAADESAAKRETIRRAKSAPGYATGAAEPTTRPDPARFAGIYGTALDL